MINRATKDALIAYDYGLMVLINATVEIIDRNLQSTCPLLREMTDFHAKQLQAYLLLLDRCNALRNIGSDELEEQSNELRGMCLSLVQTNHWKECLRNPTYRKEYLVVARLLFPDRVRSLPKNFPWLSNDDKKTAIQGWQSLFGLFATSECISEKINIHLSHKVCEE